MIIQRLFSSKAQKARRHKYDLDMAKKAEGSSFIPDKLEIQNEADRIRQGRKAIKTGKDNLGMPLETSKRSNLGDGKGAHFVHDSINKAKPGDIVNATSPMGTNPEAKKRVSERFTRSGKTTSSNFEEFSKNWRKAEILKRDARVGDAIELAKKNKGKIALATGGVVAAGIGAKKLADKKKAKKDDNPKK